MAAHVFSWLHLSDIHFGEPGAANHAQKDLILQDLLRALPRALKQGMPRPDVILVTGDLAYSGAAKNPKEYDQAGQWLTAVARAVGRTAQDVFLVPGNHDIRRARTDEEHKLLAALRKGKKRLDDVLSEAGTRKVLVSRMEPFLDFARGFAPRSTPSENQVEQGHLDWHHNWEQWGMRVVLTGLNSAFLANDADREERGRLWLGRKQLLSLNETSREDELVLVLTHHPLDYLGDKDGANRLANRAHVHLYGHIHDQDSLELRSGRGGQSVRVIAGALHAADEEGPIHYGFSFGAVVLDPDEQARLRIWPWTHVQAEADFRLDRNSLPEGQPYAEHPLGRIRVKRPVALSDEAIVVLSTSLRALCQSSPPHREVLLSRAADLNAPRLLLDAATHQNDWGNLLTELNQKPGAVKVLVRDLPQISVP